MEAVDLLPCPEGLDKENGEVEGLARALFEVHSMALMEGLPRNQLATGKASEDQIRKLHKHIAALSDHLLRLKKPAVEALELEGFGFQELLENLESKQQIVRFAFGLINPNAKIESRKTKIIASLVTEGAADVFEYVTQKPATFTTDVVSSKRSGRPWPKFLDRVFSILRIDASVAAQVAALSEKRNANQGD